eukprot:gene18947-22674_t
MTTPRPPTTFVRKGAAGVQQQAPRVPAGCKLSIQNGNLLTSTGLVDLDAILGGGVPVGSLLMIEEDVNSSFYMFLLKYFLSEGIAQSQGTFFTSLVGLDAFEVLHKLPARSKEGDEDEEASDAQAESSDLKIAWRYQGKIDAEAAARKAAAAAQTASGSQFCHSYDFSRKMNIQSIDPSHLHTLTYAATTQAEGASPYRALFTEIQTLVHKYNASASSSTTEAPRVLRIAIQSIASPLWSNDEVNNYKIISGSL